MQKTLLALALAAAAIAPAHASLSITDEAFNYTQSFDSLANTGTSPVAWANDSTIEGWSLFIKNGTAAPTYVVNNGGTSVSSFQSFGLTGETDRALGAQVNNNTYFGAAAGDIAGWIALSVKNNGSERSGFNIKFDGEQWRNNGSPTAQSMELEYGFGETFGTVSGWTKPGAAFNWSSVVNTSSQAAVDGNVAGIVAGKAGGKVANVGGDITATWAAGQTLWVRWNDKNDAGNDHALAIDNVTLSVAAVTAVPEPQTYAMLLAGLGAIGFVARRRAAK
ncbi:PEP-CTERM sorting domain-containing protein [Paucibacter sp. AS339]|uniref:PEP-CTERM sorting domain-containing protein n=1 Tax=Paucibacter hankyongi TaxID=3133434 RepID=UPI0030A7BE27